MKFTPILSSLVCCAFTLVPALPEGRAWIVTIENITPKDGNFLTPV
jgi:hypothetical protein